MSSLETICLLFGTNAAAVISRRRSSFSAFDGGGYKTQVSAAFGSDRAGWLCGRQYERQNSKCV